MMKFNEQEKQITLLEYIQHWEGFISKPYRCPAGKLTIGYGRNIQDRPLSAAEYRILFPGLTISEAMKAIYSSGVSKEKAILLLKHDLDNIIFQMKSEKWLTNLSRNRKIVIYDMCYNLGYYGLLKFRKMIKAIRECDYEEASNEIKSSRYYDQVGKRAKANCYVMRLGTFPASLSI